jgi:hypothetical protein
MKTNWGCLLVLVLMVGGFVALVGGLSHMQDASGHHEEPETYEEGWQTSLQDLDLDNVSNESKCGSEF